MQRCADQGTVPPRYRERWMGIAYAARRSEPADLGGRADHDRRPRRRAQPAQHAHQLRRREADAAGGRVALVVVQEDRRAASRARPGGRCTRPPRTAGTRPSRATAPRCRRRTAGSSRRRRGGRCCSRATTDPRPTSRRRRAGDTRLRHRDRVRCRRRSGRARMRPVGVAPSPSRLWSERPAYPTRARHGPCDEPPASVPPFPEASDAVVDANPGASTVTSCDALCVDASWFASVCGHTATAITVRRLATLIAPWCPQFRSARRWRR